MKSVPYFKQEYEYTCTLAVLRMVLAHFGMSTIESELRETVEQDYGKNFRNIWNPTIAKLGAFHGLDVKMHALWPLFKADILKKATAEYREKGDKAQIHSYENPDDDDPGTEQLSLAYKEMFKAIEEGVEVEFGALDEAIIKKAVPQEKVVLATIKLEKMYSGKNVKGYHGILIFGSSQDSFQYHDPAFGENRKATYAQLKHAQDAVRAGIVFGQRVL